MQKEDALRELEQEIASADLPLKDRANLVFGEGNVNCSVLFIGEAPGKTEDELRRPFVGRAGKLLDQCISDIGWKRSDVYITNIVKRRPPENRDPLPEEIEAYKPFLAKQIEIINPKVIATLGRFSMNYFLPDIKISNSHGRVFEIAGRVLYPLYHPAAALRATAMLNDLKKDFARLSDIALGKLSDGVLTAEFNALKQTKPKKDTSPQSALF